MRAAMGIQPVVSAPDCPKCGKRMVVANVLPRLGPYPELRSYKCLADGEVITRTIDPPDAPPYQGLERRQSRG